MSYIIEFGVTNIIYLLKRTTRDVVPKTFEDATKVPVGIDELSEATIADEVDDCSLQIQVSTWVDAFLSCIFHDTVYLC